MGDWYYHFRGMFAFYFRLYNRLEVHGAEFVPGEGGLIVASNHASYLDPMVLGAAMTRRMTYLAKEELFGMPLIGKFVSSFSFPVSRSKSSTSTIKETVRRLRAGEAIAIFPGGERAKEGDGADADFKKGIELLVRMSEANILPAYINGTHRSLPVKGKFPKPSKINVRFGPPIIYGKDCSGKDDICLMVRDSIRRLCR